MWKFGTRQPRLYGKLTKNRMIDDQIRYLRTFLIHLALFISNSVTRTNTCPCRKMLHIRIGVFCPQDRVRKM